MERIVNVINEKGEREERLLFAVDVARANDRSGIHYNYMDGDGHTYSNRTVAGSVRIGMPVTVHIVVVDSATVVIPCYIYSE